MQSTHLFSFIFVLSILGSSVCKAQDCSLPPKTIKVDQSGQGDFKTILSAIDSVPDKNSQWVHIQISAGIYKETVQISRDKTCIFLEGAGLNNTSIEWDNHENTDESATFTSSADNFVAKDITFKNTFSRPVLNSYNITPALAAAVRGDKAAFYQCAFLGVQDTLLDDDGHHYFHKCHIQGAFDFIYGRGQSIYEKTVIEYSLGKSGSTRDGGSITAHARESPDDTSGYVFKNCTVTGKEGWNAWNVDDVGNLFYAEEGCRGAGADKSKRVPWLKHLNADELKEFSNISYIDKEGWLAKLPFDPTI
ncbi:Pectinesterase [Quillaja saponaria]|uniref:pectinesterase n=1 Tax=Quillaja saponaria TaxID=32244 RepID=A0AAD7VEV0_QUISA|nr:Pectinesterase [Quillaja saponaria]